MSEVLTIVGFIVIGVFSGAIITVLLLALITKK